MDPRRSFRTVQADADAPGSLSPDKTNWANPINKPPYYGSDFPDRTEAWIEANGDQIPNER